MWALLQLHFLASFLNNIEFFHVCRSDFTHGCLLEVCASNGKLIRFMVFFDVLQANDKGSSCEISMKWKMWNSHMKHRNDKLRSIFMGDGPTVGVDICQKFSKFSQQTKYWIITEGETTYMANKNLLFYHMPHTQWIQCSKYPQWTINASVFHAFNSFNFTKLMWTII